MQVTVNDLPRSNRLEDYVPAQKLPWRRHAIHFCTGEGLHPCFARHWAIQNEPCRFVAAYFCDQLDSTQDRIDTLTVNVLRQPPGGKKPDAVDNTLTLTPTKAGLYQVDQVILGMQHIYADIVVFPRAVLDKFGPRDMAGVARENFIQGYLLDPHCTPETIIAALETRDPMQWMAQGGLWGSKAVSR